jgi:hypothetical protein
VLDLHGDVVDLEALGEAFAHAPGDEVRRDPVGGRAWSVTIGVSSATDQAWRWWTFSISGMARSRSQRISSTSRCGGAPSRRMWPLSRSSRTALTTISAATRSESSGSIGVQPVARMTAAAAMAAT